MLRNTLDFIRNFFLVGSYTQLWYFVGLIVATLLLYLVVTKLKLKDKHIAIIVLTLYVVGTIINAYISPLKESINVSISNFATLDKRYTLLWLYFKVFSTTRNGLFFGLPYLFFGYLIAKNKDKIYRKNYALLSAISFVVMTGEALLVHNMFGGHEQDMLFMLMPTSILLFLFILFIDCDCNSRKLKYAKHFRSMSVLYFGLHTLIKFYLNVIMHKGFNIVLHSVVSFLIVVFLNYVAAEIIIRMSEFRNFKWLKRFY